MKNYFPQRLRQTQYSKRNRSFSRSRFAILFYSPILDRRFFRSFSCLLCFKDCFPFQSFYHVKRTKHFFATVVYYVLLICVVKCFLLGQPQRRHSGAQDSFRLVYFRLSHRRAGHEKEDTWVGANLGKNDSLRRK